MSWCNSNGEVLASRIHKNMATVIVWARRMRSLCDAPAFVVDQCAVYSADGWIFDSECCTPSRPCTTGQGGCSDDEDCAGELYCGANNCVSLNPTALGFPSDGNCCTGTCNVLVHRMYRQQRVAKNY